MTDPYQVLGISSNATDDEVKKAYRELSRKYHPDSYANNPLADLAEDKFKEVQEAYNQIMKERENGYSRSTGGFGGGYSSGGYSSSSYGGGYSSTNNTGELQSVYTLLSQRRFRDALDELSRTSNRSAKWYYYSAVANSGIGNNIQALDHARTANSMDPGNQEYANFLDQLQYGNRRYQSTGYGYGRPNSSYGGGDTCGTGNACCDLWIADSCCEMMGGDLCSCM
ncbi:MAG: J domain-containing protein [bacterium]|nr:J domain-containing protein [bacterium]